MLLDDFSAALCRTSSAQVSPANLAHHLAVDPAVGCPACRAIGFVVRPGRARCVVSLPFGRMEKPECGGRCVKGSFFLFCMIGGKIIADSRLSIVVYSARCISFKSLPSLGIGFAELLLTTSLRDSAASSCLGPARFRDGRSSGSTPRQLLREPDCSHHTGRVGDALAGEVVGCAMIG